MDFTLSPHQLQLEEKATLFAEQEITPHISRLEEDVDFRLALFQKMAHQGLFLLSVPTHHGGRAQEDTLSYLLALKAIAKADAGISVAMAVSNMAAEAISIYGTEKQHKGYISKIAGGEYVPLSFALTEKDAGSDAKNLETTAVLRGENYQIDGEKQFITNGDISAFTIVMAKTDPSKGAEGISAFIVDKGTPGFTVVKKEKKLGLLTANLVSLRFDHCLIPAENLLGHEGEGFKIAMGSLNSGRLGIAAQALGIAEAAYENALHHARRRHQFGHAIAENQAIAFKLADMDVKLNASRLLLAYAAWKKDSGNSFTLEASEAKLYCTESCNEIVNEALQIFGGYGYIKDYPMEKYFRDARVTTLYEGTSEIQRIVISRHILSERQL